MKWAPLAAAIVIGVIVAMLIWQPFEKITQNDGVDSEFRAHTQVDQGQTAESGPVIPSNHTAQQRSAVEQNIPSSAEADPSPEAEVVRTSPKVSGLVSRDGARQNRVFEQADRFATAQNLNETTADHLRTILLTEAAVLAATRDPKKRAAALRETDKLARSLLTNKQFGDFRQFRQREPSRPRRGFR